MNSTTINCKPPCKKINEFTNKTCFNLILSDGTDLHPFFLDLTLEEKIWTDNSNEKTWKITCKMHEEVREKGRKEDRRKGQKESGN